MKEQEIRDLAKENEIQSWHNKGIDKIIAELAEKGVTVEMEEVIGAEEIIEPEVVIPKKKKRITVDNIVECEKLQKEKWEVVAIVPEGNKLKYTLEIEIE